MRGFRLFFVFSICIGAVFAQTANPATQLDVVVTDATGKPVTNLARESFLLFEDGEGREIRSFSAVDTPWNIVLLFDNGLTWLESGNGPQTPASATAVWAQMGRSVSLFLGRLSPKDRVAMAAFENKVQLLMDWRNIRTGKNQEVVFRPAVRGADGTKDLYGALLWAIDKLRGVQGRKAVILLTDGRDGRLAPQWLTNGALQEVFDPLFGQIDTAEAEEFLKLRESVRTSGARLFFLAVSTARTPEFRGRPISGFYPGAKEAIAGYQARARLRMERMAADSQGGVLFGNAPEDALAAFERLHDHLSLGTRYTLEYSSSRQAEEIPPRIEIRLQDKSLKAHFLKGAR